MTYLYRQWKVPAKQPVAAGRRHSAGGGISRGENIEFWNLAASSKLTFAMQTVIFKPSNNPIFPLILPSFGTMPTTASASQLHTKQRVCTPRNLHCWPDWSSTCCKTVEDPYCPVTFLLAIAIHCLALFTCFQIPHKIWIFCMIFGNLIIRKIFKFVATKCQILRLKIQIQFRPGLCPRYRWANFQRSPRPSNWI